MASGKCPVCGQVWEMDPDGDGDTECPECLVELMEV